MNLQGVYNMRACKIISLLFSLFFFLSCTEDEIRKKFQESVIEIQKKAKVCKTDLHSLYLGVGFPGGKEALTKKAIYVGLRIKKLLEELKKRGMKLGIMIDPAIRKCKLTQKAMFFNLGTTEALSVLARYVPYAPDDKVKAVDRIAIVISDKSGQKLYDLNKYGNNVVIDSGKLVYQIFVNLGDYQTGLTAMRVAENIFK